METEAAREFPDGLQLSRRTGYLAIGQSRRCLVRILVLRVLCCFNTGLEVVLD
jgi:hypothetical protein